MNGDRLDGGTTRREFLAMTGAAALAASAWTQPHEARGAAAAMYRRKNLSDPANKNNVDCYERGIAAMLALPPEDPRNWYRYALIHFIDCPHGNWWFLPWHRGYIGWLERIIRDLTGTPTFALPYWDWTADGEQRIPSRFFEGMLNPANFKIQDFARFKAGFVPPTKEFFNNLNLQQKQQLVARSFPNFDAIWTAIEHDDPADSTSPSDFSDIRSTRQLTAQLPCFDDKSRKAVTLATILDALAPRQFVDFASAKAPNHQIVDNPNKGVLESQPHDNVHNVVGGSNPRNGAYGFMSAFLSPIDPLFYMHHSNIDRLWDVWTRKQLAHGDPVKYPTTPIGPDLATWNAEPFLFFVGVDGKPVAQQTAGDYVATNFFGYDYQPGSGEIVVPGTPTPSNSLSGQSIAATMEAGESRLGAPIHSSAKIPADLGAATGIAGGVRVVAEVVAEYPRQAGHVGLHVLLNVPAGPRPISFDDPSYAGTYRPFGHYHAGDGAHARTTVTFRIGLTEAVSRLVAAKRMAAGDALRVAVVPEVDGIGIDLSVFVKAITIKTY